MSFPTTTDSAQTVLLSSGGLVATVQSRLLCEMQFLNLQLVKNRAALRSAAPWLSTEFRAAAILVSEEFRKAEQRIFGPREAERLQMQEVALTAVGAHLGDVVQVRTASGRTRTFRLHGATLVGRIGHAGRPQGYRLFGLGVNADASQREFETCIVNSTEASDQVRIIARVIGSGAQVHALPPERTPTFASEMTEAQRSAWLETPRQPDLEETMVRALDALTDSGLQWIELASTQPELALQAAGAGDLASQKAVRTLFNEGPRIKIALDQERRRRILRAFLRVIPGQILDLSEEDAAPQYFRFEGLEQIGETVALRGRRQLQDGTWAPSLVLEFIDSPARALQILARSRMKGKAA